MTCPSCGTGNEPGRKFCGECGAKLALPCPACGASNTPGTKFCGECGAALAAPASTPAPTPDAERRLVSVLFADLVGFTTLSESRDAEEVRELLSRYFDTARQVIGRYGGTIEKFIGDAVMAVWGAPVAREDDAERAVRAALDLVDAVSALVPGLAIRAGVLTGEAAVTIGAEGQGMVAGDLVNTASRIQSLAAAGTVLVGETTRRMTEAAIAYEDAGDHELKGKAEDVRLWRALRVVATRGGEARSAGLEAPFVGRAGELRLVKELFHTTIDEGKARLVSVIGVAGIGKSRLAWEFEKHVDGLIDDVWWHRGRCLAYGEGVAYWALAEMVRWRSGIQEDEAPESAQAKLRSTVERFVPDAEERIWIEPRLRHLLGLTERTAPDQQDLFSAWRRFFELMAGSGPVVLLFEDLHWADAGLLDFVEYLLEWSRNHPIYVLTLARPELVERRPSWGAGRRSFSSLFLEPLADEAREELLRGLVPGLPDDLRARIGERAEGVPLYAIETVRMLLDRGVLTRENDEYRVTGSVDALEVPETLHALLAARLDGLEPAERHVLENASVLGKTFTLRGLAQVSGQDEQALEPLLASLSRKEILALQADPFSPERGQYEFLHALVQKVAYDTLSRRERKARHLAVARYLEAEWGRDDPEVVEVVAAHYLEAYRAAPDEDDAAAIKAAASDRLTRAAERAASLAANEEAQRYFGDAAELADEPLTRAELLERAGEMARTGARFDEAEAMFEQSIALLETEGRIHTAARVSARLGEVLFNKGRSADAVSRMEEALAVLSGDEPDADLAMLAAGLARVQFLMGAQERAAEQLELALEIAEALELPEILAQALATKSLVLENRPAESEALVRQALRIALEHELAAAAMRAYGNLGHRLYSRDRIDEAIHVTRDAVALARRWGDRPWEWFALANLVEFLAPAGEWNEAIALGSEFPDEARAARGSAFPAETLMWIEVERGNLEAARALSLGLAGRELSEDYQERAYGAVAFAAVARAEGRHGEAFDWGVKAFNEFMLHGDTLPGVNALAEAAAAALTLGDLGQVRELLSRCAALPPVARTRYLRAQEARFAARLAASGTECETVDPDFRRATETFRELGMPFWLAVTLLEHGEWLTSEGRAGEAAPLLEEAHVIFERLEARPWLERLEAVHRPTEAVAG
jgi:predicted ATPase/class 3 adenylate cyclase